MINLTNHIPNILVVGDLMIDHYVWGTCERISPEAPVQILKVQKENNRLGGACNVANNLISLGAKVSLCGIVGDDSDGNILLKMLEDSNIDIDLIAILNNFHTIKKTRLIAARQQVLRVDRECEIVSLDSQMILDKIASKINEFDSIIISDYAKGALSKDFTQSLINLANSFNKIILCDPKGNDYSKYANATLITPNRKEAENATNIKIDSKDSLFKAGFKLKEMCNLQYAIITLSEDGMAIFDSQMTEIPTLAREVFDVTGAGDTVIAALAFGLSCKLDIYKSAEFANAAAAVVVGKIGSASATLGEIFSYKNDISKDREIDNLLLIENLKKDGKKIVFTNGCFDIIHIGHISYLKKAKSFGDILVVGLNSDNSVRILKGKNRPINNEKDRAFVLASLSCVDFVVIFDEETPYNLIKKIKPDILVKGGDYNGKDVVGSDIVKDTRIVEFIPNMSTTNIVNKIKGESNE
ncbi:bifunctional heptose 7-phosphate kinase/heptose 1-phosphate adenyltransferase [Helicobacter sp. 16-1353]|uniref:D-glycero-beta-D-manno-heptose-7-phosphate kinase n=1 Tax=Helicobacter sp. 16-1353 TaxID=2004996 RepID=UPI000DCC4D74|nr:D-glycero-beta-D-manno-heptose-7-phosphate kinase [Helicobacter sp. 16-1353]RAX53844.1 bifunctional heptose 7-phosphate kinase/heptose 1-phosphate adenyltransferase [Helicobacter sp. 16-1353]